MNSAATSRAPGSPGSATRRSAPLVVEGIGSSPAILLKNHGVFTVGATPTAAVKAAVMVEDIAATTWVALQIGSPEAIPADEVARLHRRYTTAYGQSTDRDAEVIRGRP